MTRHRGEVILLRLTLAADGMGITGNAVLFLAGLYRAAFGAPLWKTVLATAGHLFLVFMLERHLRGTAAALRALNRTQERA